MFKSAESKLLLLIIVFFVIFLVVILSQNTNTSPIEETDSSMEKLKISIPQKAGIYKFQNENNTCYFYMESNNLNAGSLSCVRN